jgi:aldehyde:ferredoxin oxidoreductase
MEIGGYLGKVLRVDLSSGKTSVEELDQSFIEKWVGEVLGSSIYQEGGDFTEKKVLGEKKNLIITKEEDKDGKK